MDYGDTVTVIGPSGVLSPFTVGSAPLGVAVSPTGPDAGNVFVATNQATATSSPGGFVSMIDPNSNKVTPISLDNSSEIGEFGVAVSPTGANAGDVYITGLNGYPANAGVVSVLTPNPTPGSFNVTNISLSTTTIPEGVAVSPQTGDVYVAGAVATNSNGTTTYQSMLTVIGTGNTITGTIPITELNSSLRPTAVAVSPTTGDIYVTNAYPGNATGVHPGTVSVIDPTDGQTMQTINVGDNPAGVAVSPTTGDVYVTNGSDDTVTMIDPNHNYATTTFGVGESPIGVAVSPTGTTNAGDVYVANADARTVSVITSATPPVSPPSPPSPPPPGPLGPIITTIENDIAGFVTSTIRLIRDLPPVEFGLGLFFLRHVLAALRV